MKLVFLPETFNFDTRMKTQYVCTCSFFKSTTVHQID